MTSKLAVIILAAGKGTRMGSDLPKALHSVCGETMLGHLLTRAEKTRANRILVVAGHKIELVKESIGRRAQIVLQKELLGSGHAVSLKEPSRG